MEMHLDKDAEKELQQLENSINALIPALRNHVYGESTVAAARVMAKEAKASPHFNDRTGALRKSIKAVRVDVTDAGTGKTIKKGGAAAVIGGRGAPHAHLIEFGTVDRTQSSTGRFAGRIKPRRMLQDALDTKQSASLEAAVKAARRKFSKLIDAAKAGRFTKSQERVAGK